MIVAFIYSLGWQLVIYFYHHKLGGLFVDDLGIIKEVSRISPAATLTLFILGPMLIITMYFQAIGDAKRAGLLSMAKTYAFLLPLLFVLPISFSEWGIWYAGPVAETLGLVLTLGVLYQRQQSGGYKYGLFKVL